MITRGSVAIGSQCGKSHGLGVPIRIRWEKAILRPAGLRPSRFEGRGGVKSIVNLALNRPYENGTQAQADAREAPKAISEDSPRKERKIPGVRAPLGARTSGSRQFGAPTRETVLLIEV